MGCGESRRDLELLLSPSSDSAGWWECPWQRVPWMVTLWGSLNSCMPPRVNSLIGLWLLEINPCKEPSVEKNELNEINMADIVIFSCCFQYFSFSYTFSFKFFLQLWSSQVLPFNLSTPKYLLHIFPIVWFLTSLPYGIKLIFASLLLNFFRCSSSPCWWILPCGLLRDDNIRKNLVKRCLWNAGLGCAEEIHSWQGRDSKLLNPWIDS